jgi:putative heme-binding domain-containing protein
MHCLATDDDFESLRRKGIRDKRRGHCSHHPIGTCRKVKSAFILITQNQHTSPLMKKLIPGICAALTLSAHAAPADLKITKFAGSDITPSPACLAAAATGEVYVGVDLLGSLGKGPGMGRIIRLVDSDHDGKADSHTVFAEIDNPRGLISMGDKLYVLHTIIPKETKILSEMNLSVLEDKNGDGIADGPPKILIQNISVAKHNQDRGADHTTNGIRMGIDGWIYIAVGDFGFVNAKGTDGTTLTMLGGGVLRVRPDGSEMEVYTHGLRNIYDVAIDPFMNMFTRGNTNDGGGWNVRFIHQIQAGEYGYPVLFKSFTNEIIPALVDVGGGSGTGSLFMDEPSWPEKYNKQPMMADWGRNMIFIHRLTPDGASFTQNPEDFIGLSQPSDLDVDGSGQLYIAAWEGAGYKGNPERGFIERAVPEGWTYKAFPDLTKLQPDALIKGLNTESATARLATQQEILSRGDKSMADAVLTIAKDGGNPAASRVAAIFTYKQLLGTDANAALLELSKDETLKEFALRALTDRLTQLDGLSVEPFSEALASKQPRVQAVAAISLGRLGKKEAADALLAFSNPPDSETTVASTPKPPLFESGKISGTESVDIDISLVGINNLYLIVDDGGNGDGGDHAGWFDPILTNRDGKKVPLTKLKWQSATQGWGKTLVNKSPNGKPIVRADGKPFEQAIGTHATSVIHYVIPGAMQHLTVTAALASTKNPDSAVSFRILSEPPAGKSNAEGPHATPNSSIIVPHLAVHSLVRLHAVEACLAAVGSSSNDGALWALRLMHDPAVVDGLLEKYASANDADLKNKILATLSRLYTKEAPYDGSWWWSTKPDTRGPYYKPVTWEKSEAIEKLFRDTFATADTEGKAHLTFLANRHRMNLEGIGEVEKAEGDKVKTIGDISIENIMLDLDKMKGDSKKGMEIMKTQACIACHSIQETDPKRGPELNHIGASLDREAIAEAILKPDAGISESWVDVTKTDDSIIQGTLVDKTDAQVVIRDIAGVPTTLKASEVKGIKTSASTLMGPHLMDTLTMEQFADVIAYLHSLK